MKLQKVRQAKAIVFKQILNNYAQLIDEMSNFLHKLGQKRQYIALSGNRIDTYLNHSCSSNAHKLILNGGQILEYVKLGSKLGRPDGKLNPNNKPPGEPPNEHPVINPAFDFGTNLGVDLSIGLDIDNNLDTDLGNSLGDDIVFDFDIDYSFVTRFENEEQLVNLENGSVSWNIFALAKVWYKDNLICYMNPY